MAATAAQGILDVLVEALSGEDDELIEATIRSHPEDAREYLARAVRDIDLEFSERKAESARLENESRTTRSREARDEFVSYEAAYRLWKQERISDRNYLADWLRLARSLTRTTLVFDVKGMEELEVILEGTFITAFAHKGGNSREVERSEIWNDEMRHA